MVDTSMLYQSSEDCIFPDRNDETDILTMIYGNVTIQLHHTLHYLCQPKFLPYYELKSCGFVFNEEKQNTGCKVAIS